MRIGYVLESVASTVGAHAAAAELHGLFAVMVGGPAGTECTAGAYAAAATSYARIVVRVHMGVEHPVTLAEEITVLDNASNGRVAVMADVASLSADDAVEDVGLLRAALSSTPIQHSGSRWQVAPHLPEHNASASVIVTPAPAQIEVPVWVLGDTSGACGVPVVRTALDQELGLWSGLVRPGLVTLTGSMVEDRALVMAWASAGISHLLVQAPVASLSVVSRYLQPEVGMVGFPRVIADAALPVVWAPA